MNRMLLIFAIFLLSFSLGACTDDDSGGDDDQSPADDDDNDDSGADDDNNDDADDDDDDDDSSPEGVYVAPSGNDDNPGTKELPKRTIHAGLAAATAGEAQRPVHVAEGIYQEALTVRTSLLGGYRASDWTRNIAEYKTVVESQHTNGFVVKHDSAEEVLIEGLVIRGATTMTEGTATGVLISQGAVRLSRNKINAPGANVEFSTGVVARSSQRVVIEDCEIASGYAQSDSSSSVTSGVAVSGSATQVELRRNTIRASLALAGGTAMSTGLYVDADDAIVIVDRNEIYAAPAVAAVFGFSDGAEVISGLVLFTNNVIGGGAAFGQAFMGSAGVHTNTTAAAPAFVGNTILGGLALWSYALELEGAATVVNNILVAGRNPVFAYNPGNDLVLMNNDLVCRSAECALLGLSGEAINAISKINACEWSGCQEAGGNISAEPGITTWDAHLPAGSPCIGAGVDPTSWFNEAEAYWDIDGDARPQLLGWDIGADEFTE